MFLKADGYASDAYCVTVQPGIDHAFAVLVVIALDELYHDPMIRG